MKNWRKNLTIRKKFSNNLFIQKTMTWEKESFGTIKFVSEKEFKNWKNNKKCRKNRKSQMKMMMMKKMNKVKKNQKNKMNSKKMMRKNQISTSLKMIIKTLKESEKSVNMIKKYKKIKNVSLIFKNKEIKSLTKSKISTINWLKQKNNLKSIKRKNYSKLINYMSHFQSKHHKSNTWLTLMVKINCKKTLVMQFYSKRLHSVG